MSLPAALATLVPVQLLWQLVWSRQGTNNQDRMSIRMLATTVIVVTLGGAALMSAVYLYQDRMLFLPNMPGRELTASPTDIGLDYQQVSVPTEDGETLHGWLIPGEIPGRLLIFFHGNAGNISHRLESIAVFNRLGLAVLIVDYRGYGQSTGKPSEPGSTRDALAVWRYATGDLGYTPAQIVVFGRSLGGSIATRLAAEVRPAALIIESAFTSVPDVARELYPLLPVSLLARLRFDTLTAMAEVSSPVMVIHSRDDEIIAFHHGQALYQQARERQAPVSSEFVELRGGHNDGFLVSRETYTQALRTFVNSIYDQDRN